MNIFDLQHAFAIGYAGLIGYLAHDDPKLWVIMLFIWMAAHDSGRAAAKEHSR